MPALQQPEKSVLVTVKLYGTLPQRFESYDPQKGLRVRLGPGARVSDLVRHLGFTDETVVAVVDGRVAGGDAPLAEGAAVNLLQPAHGG